MKIKFGTSGWRAIISDEFTFANVRVVTAAIARYLKEAGVASQGVVVGYDTRFLSAEFSAVAAQTLAAEGIKSFLTVRDTPTPAIASEIRFRKAAGGINLTASHNPATYNGIKFSPSWGGPATPEITKTIEDYANKFLADGYQPASMDMDKAVEQGLIEKIDIRPRYLEEIRSKINLDAIRKANLSVAADVLYGTGREYLDTLLQDAGVKVNLLHSWRDPYFGNDIPEPNEEHLPDLLTAMRTGQYNLGLATDGDADRFGIIDSDGTFITPNQVLALLFLHLMESRRWKGSVVRTVPTTHLIDTMAAKHGVKVHVTPVGFKYIGELMENEPVIIGGEESGGLSIMGHVPEKDGLIACMLLTEMVAIRKETLKETLAYIEKTYGKFCTGRVDLRLTPEKKEALWSEIQTGNSADFAGLKIVNRENVDGIGWELEDGTFTLVRPSGTEPLLRCYAESRDEAKLNKVLEAFRKLS